jgi:hypothetical protein
LPTPWKQRRNATETWVSTSLALPFANSQSESISQRSGIRPSYNPANTA